MDSSPRIKPERVGLALTIILYVVSIAFQYGIFSQRVAALETTIQEIKADVKEIRDHVWAVERKN